MTLVADAAATQRLASRPGESVWVAASAGTAGSRASNFADKSHFRTLFLTSFASKSASSSKSMVVSMRRLSVTR